MNLDDIQLSIFETDLGVGHAIQLLSSYLDKKSGLIDKEKDNNIKEYIKDIMMKRSQISPLALNRIATTERIKTYYRQVIPGTYVNDPVGLANQLIRTAEDDLNRRIISAKDTHTKSNRVGEKTYIMKYFMSYKEDIVRIFELYNLFIKVKEEINK
jgi:hypothetical protein